MFSFKIESDRLYYYYDNDMIDFVDIENFSIDEIIEVINDILENEV